MNVSLVRVLDELALSTPPGIHLGLSRVRAMLARLGHPEQRLQTIHVAGTNGKGSVVAFLEAILIAQGYVVGAYTSPHLVRFNERIRIQGRDVADEPIIDAILEVQRISGDIPATWFEKTTVAAFSLFVRQGLAVDGARPALILLETGLGGRLDATNVVHPLMTLITAIGLDHMDYLGTDIESIAREKAGILKAGVPAFTSCACGPAREVIVEHARNVAAPLYLPGRDFRYGVVGEGGLWTFEDASGRVSLPVPGLAGLHQFENAALAVAAIRHLTANGWPVSQSAMEDGLRRVRWPGRMERFPGQPDILLDGAHNPLGMAALVQALAEDNHPPSSRTLIFSALDDKDIVSMVRILEPWVGEVFVVSVGGQRRCGTAKLKACWQTSHRVAYEVPDLRDALSQALAVTSPTGQLLITGSLYLVGQVRSLIESRSSFVAGYTSV